MSSDFDIALLLAAYILDPRFKCRCVNTRGFRIARHRILEITKQKNMTKEEAISIKDDLETSITDKSVLRALNLLNWV